MTSWLKSKENPLHFTIDDECEIKDKESEGGTVRCKNMDLFSAQVENHLDTGKEVVKLSLTWEDEVSFLTDENLAIKRIKILDILQEQQELEEIESEEQQFDSDFSLMIGVFTDIIQDLSDSFDGLVY
jgi:recombination associated protein RdgC